MNGLVKELGAGFQYVTLDMDRRTEREDANRRYGQTSFPSYVLLDAKGNIIKRMIGPQSDEVLRQSMLAVSAPAQ